MSCSASTVIAFATICAICALTLIALGFSTNHWQEIDVRTDSVRSEANSKAGYSALTYYERNTGLFRICYPESPAVLDSIGDKPDASCVKQEWEIPSRDSNDEPSDAYWTRVHLMRAVIAFFILCILLLLISIILGCIACWVMNPLMARIAGILVLFATFFGVGGMAMWHGAEYMEFNKIEDYNLAGVPDFPQSWTQTLEDNTEKSYGWSYIVMWIGIALCLFAGVLYLIAAATLLAKISRTGRDTFDGSRRSDRSRSRSPYGTKERYSANSANSTIVRTQETVPVVYAYDSNYLKKQPFAYPEQYEATTETRNNSWGWNDRY